MQGQDIAILLKLAIQNEPQTRSKNLAESLSVSESEVSKALKRCAAAGLLYISGAEKRVNRSGLMEFLAHGLKYVFPPEKGSMTRGIPTAAAAEPLKSRFLDKERNHLRFGRMRKERFAAFPSPPSTKVHPKPRCAIPSSTASWPSAMRSAAAELANEISQSNFWKKRSMPDPNLPLLEDAVRKLAPFLDEIVFVGGVTLGLLITDEAAAPIRGTTDVDVVAEIATYADYIAFSERLRQAHFTEDTSLSCRWHNGALTLDVLALNKEVLGFTNIWYEPALRHASTLTLPGGQTIRVITAPFFLGTKMEAFRGRGKMDFQASHDLEDFVAVVEGRETVVQEIVESPQDLRDYLAEAVKSLLAESRFLDVLPGFVLDSERVPLIQERLALIAADEFGTRQEDHRS